jgi:hypothetical protein
MRRDLLLLGSLACAGCAAGSSTGPSPSVADLAGTWVINRWERTAEASPSKRQDLLAAGYSGSITISSSGSFSLHATLPGRASVTETGRITMRGDTLVYDPDEDPYEFILTLSAGSMTWVAIELEFNDVDGDGSPEDTRETLGFRRS